MTIPLNELSAIYNQSIAEGCDCEDKKKEKKVTLLPQGNSVDGGDSAKPGKNKNYVKPMATEEKEESKIGGGNLKKLAAKANKRIDADVDGDVDTDDPKSTEMGEFIPSADGKKKVKTMPRFEAYSQWRNDLREIVDVADQEEATKSSPKTDTEASKQIKEKNVKNKIKINPPQGVTEGFEEIGGVVVEMYEIGEDYKELPKRKMGMKAGKKIISAVGHAGKAGAEGEGTIEDQIRMQKAGKKVKQADKIHDTAGKHNPNLSKLKSMKNRLTGMTKESVDMTGAPSIKDAKPAKKTDVKYDSHMKVMAPSIKKEGLSVVDQMKVSSEYFKKRAARSPEEKESEKKKNAEARSKISAMHKKPDPYKARAGESD